MRRSASIPVLAAMFGLIPGCAATSTGSTADLEDASPADASLAPAPDGTGTGDATPDAPPASDGGDPAQTDARAPVPDFAAPPVGDPCVPACERISACVTESCGAGAETIGAEVAAACAAECAASPSFPLQVAELAACEAVLSFAATNVGAPLEAGCPNGTSGVPHAPVCDVFGDRFATCVTDRCPPAGEQRDLIVPAYTHLCDLAAQRGDFDPDQLAILLTANTPCDSPILTGPLDNATGDGGLLVNFCATGPVGDMDACTRACGTLSPCIADDSPLAVGQDPNVCTLLCVDTDQVPRPAWACAAALPAEASCNDATACLAAMGPDAGAACQTFAERVTACALERCPGLAEVTAGHTLFVTAQCNDQVAADPAALEAVSAVAGDTPCDDPTVGATVGALVDGGIDAPLCEAGPLNPIEAICRPACATVGPCLPANGDLAAYRDPAACEFYCAQAPDALPAAAWTCFAAAMSCADAFACVQ